MIRHVRPAAGRTAHPSPRLRSEPALSEVEGAGHSDRSALPSRHFDRSGVSREVEKSGHGRGPATGTALWRRWSARRVSPLRLRSGQATPPRPGAGAPVEMTGWGCCHFATQGDDFRGNREIVRDRTAAHRQYPPCQTGRLSAAPGGIPKLSVFNPCVFPVPDVPVGRVTRQHWRGR